jgi:hypothetical protein
MQDSMTMTESNTLAKLVHQALESNPQITDQLIA